MNIEEFVNDYLQEHRHEVLLSPYNGLVEFAEALKAEALKEAVEKTICLVPSLVGPKMFTTSIELSADELKGFKPGDKVRVIILQKED